MSVLPRRRAFLSNLLKKGLKIYSCHSKHPSLSKSSHLQIMATSTSAICGSSVGNKKTICIEGNIGSGKTVLLDYFSQTDGVQVMPEPVDVWRNDQGHNMLGLLYEDPVRWSFLFQSYVQLSMVLTHQVPHTHPLKMMERSIFSAKYCFVDNLYNSGKMSDAEYAVITAWFDWIVQNSFVKVDQIIYLRASPEHCYKRIRVRNRKEEMGISLEYLSRLDELHEDWLIHQTKLPLPAPVLVIDANHPMEDMLQYYKDHRNDILTPRQNVIQS